MKDYKMYDVRVWSDGTTEWFMNGVLHRENGPCIENSYGTKAWYLRGKLHREDGPAIEFADGTKCWYINDENLTEEQFNARRGKIDF